MNPILVYAENEVTELGIKVADYRTMRPLGYVRTDFNHTTEILRLLSNTEGVILVDKDLIYQPRDSFQMRFEAPPRTIMQVLG